MKRLHLGITCIACLMSSNLMADIRARILMHNGTVTVEDRNRVKRIPNHGPIVSGEIINVDRGVEARLFYIDDDKGAKSAKYYTLVGPGRYRLTSKGLTMAAKNGLRPQYDGSKTLVAQLMGASKTVLGGFNTKGASSMIFPGSGLRQIPTECTWTPDKPIIDRTVDPKCELRCYIYEVDESDPDQRREIWKNENLKGSDYRFPIAADSIQIDTHYQIEISLTIPGGMFQKTLDSSFYVWSPEKLIQVDQLVKKYMSTGSVKDKLLAAAILSEYKLYGEADRIYETVQSSNPNDKFVKFTCADWSEFKKKTNLR